MHDDDKTFWLMLFLLFSLVAISALVAISLMEEAFGDDLNRQMGIRKMVPTLQTLSHKAARHARQVQALDRDTHESLSSRQKDEGEAVAIARKEVQHFYQKHTDVQQVVEKPTTMRKTTRHRISVNLSSMDGNLAKFWQTTQTRQGCETLRYGEVQRCGKLRRRQREDNSWH
jgi:hypothetical protein